MVELNQALDGIQPDSFLTEEEKEKLEDLSNRNKSEMDDSELTELVETSLQRKFSHPEWGLIYEVTGKNGNRIDAIAFNLYQSRNFRTIAFEIKVSRSDWKKELSKPSKNDYFVGQADEFYVVAGRKGIVKESELPDGWGLYEMKGGGKLYKEVESNPTSHQDRPVDREYFARITKQALENRFSTEKNINYALKRAYNQGKKDSENQADLSREQEKLIKKGEKLESYEEHGLNFKSWSQEKHAENLKEALELVKEISDRNMSSLGSTINGLESKAEQLEDKIEKVDKKYEELQESIEAVDETPITEFIDTDNAGESDNQ